MNNRILVIEDSSEMLDLMRLLLEPEGYSMVSANSATEALDALKQSSKFMLILMDLNLPDMSAQDLLIRMKEAGVIDRTPILFFSAARDLHHMTLPDGVVGVIQKPFKVQKLLETIEHYKSAPLFRFVEAGGFMIGC